MSTLETEYEASAVSGWVTMVVEIVVKPSRLVLRRRFGRKGLLVPGIIILARITSY